MVESMLENKLEQLSDMDIVLYALFILGGWQKRVHTEDIALKCFKLAPTKFSWVKYPKYPDLAPARFALEAAKKVEKGALVKGESERKKVLKNIGGWMLTSNGVKWIENNKDRIEKYLGKHLPSGNRLPADRKLKEVLNSVAFRKFLEHGKQADISHAEFADSLVCTVNTRPEILNDRLEQLFSIAEKLNQEEIKKYIMFIRNKFASLLNLPGENENVIK